MLAQEIMDAVDAVNASGSLGPLAVSLAITAPPCPGCRNWVPLVQTDASLRQITVTLCQSTSGQLVDFSCFDPIA